MMNYTANLLHSDPSCNMPFSCRSLCVIILVQEVFMVKMHEGKTSVRIEGERS